MNIQKTTNNKKSIGCCRFCGTDLHHTFVDLGMSPPCESYRKPEQLNEMEPFYPLHVYVCEQCFLVQLQEYIRPENIFSDYAYFSSYSDSWLQHAKNYVYLVVKRDEIITQMAHIRDWGGQFVLPIPEVRIYS